MQLIGFLSALASSASWALGSVLFKRIGERMTPSGMTLAKSILGILLLGLAYSLHGLMYIPPYAMGMLFLSGVIGISLGDTLFFASLQELGPKIQIIFFMLGQVMTALLALLILREMPTRMQWLGILITLVGVVVVLWEKIFADAQQKKTKMRGIALGLLSMFCFSFSIIIAKHAMVTVSTLGATFIRMWGGTLGILVYGLWKRQVAHWLNPLKDFRLLIFFVISVCVVIYGGFWLSLVAVKFLDVAVASTLSATEPFFILLIARIFLKERMAFSEAVGAILTVGGIVCVIFGSMK